MCYISTPTTNIYYTILITLLPKELHASHLPMPAWASTFVIKHIKLLKYTDLGRFSEGRWRAGETDKCYVLVENYLGDIWLRQLSILHILNVMI